MAESEELPEDEVLVESTSTSSSDDDDTLKGVFGVGLFFCLVSI